MSLPFSPSVFETELRANILPFWMNQTLDHENGGFYGALTNDLQVVNSVERSAVLCARLLWTFSTAYRLYQEAAYLQVARHAYNYLTQHFWDAEHGGVYWSVDLHGNPVVNYKHTYAQSFAIYGLSEYYRASGEPECLRLAQELFRLVEAHTFDPDKQGNLECRGRAWQALGDMRLSPKDLNCAKSMNTLLHLIEAYTNLMRICDHTELKNKQRGLLRAFFEHVVDPQSFHLKLFFDQGWKSLSNDISYGHDIEASWLLVEAAEVLGDLELMTQARVTAVKMAQAVYAQGRNADGSLLYELTPEGPQASRHWWVQAEAVVGFYHAYQVSGQAHFAQAAGHAWEYIQAKLIDRQHGDWFKVLDPHNRPYSHQYKVGPWECPYHHSRVCFEMIRRLTSAIPMD